MVGDEIFDVDNVQCTIKVEPDGLFMYTYKLLVDGKSLEDFCEHVSKTRSTWLMTTADGVQYRVGLGNIFPKKKNTKPGRGWYFGDVFSVFVN